MRISDWSSDVCSSDLAVDATRKPQHHAGKAVARHIIVQAHHHRAIDVGRTRIERVLVARLAHPAIPLAPPVGEDDRLLPVLHLEGEAAVGVQRSEEHTSELQSLMRISYAVFCLKKKK